MEAVLLKFLDLFRWAFTLMKADYEQLRAIVAIKLTMDNRRQIVAYRRKGNQEPGNAFLMTLFFYGIFGGLMAIMISGIPSVMIAMIVFYSYIMVMIAMTLITDFSAVLLDTSDNTIILPRPVDSRTLFLARSTHILLYLGMLALSLSIFPCVAVLVRYGVLAMLVFIVLVALSVIAAVSLTNVFYLLILQFTSEERLKNVINYFQIIMAVAIMGGYQLMPRLMGRLDTETVLQFDIQWWHIFIPPVWMAAALDMFYSGLYNNQHLLFAACAVIIPLAGFYLMNRYLTPVFSRKLGAMGSGGSGTESVSTIQRRSSWLDRIAPAITVGPLERGAFELIYRILGRDRKIKLKLYPAFGYVLVFGVVFTLRNGENLAATWHNLPQTHYHLVLLYLTFMVLQVALYEIPYSDDFKASWIYFSLPLESPGDILSGMLKAILVRLFMPAYLAVSAFVIIVWGISALDDIVFGFFNNIIMLQCLAMIGNRHLPLSMAPNVRGQSGNFLRGLLMFILVGALGLSHYLLTKLQPLVVLSIIPVQLVLIYILQRSYRKTAWDSIKY